MVIVGCEGGIEGENARLCMVVEVRRGERGFGTCGNLPHVATLL